MLGRPVIRVAALCTLALLGLMRGSATAQPVMDYGHEEFSQGHIAALRGQADFRWQLLLTPCDFAHDAAPAELIDIPGDWAQGTQKTKIVQHEGLGFGTYHFTLKLPKRQGQQYALLMPVVHGSWRLWIDGTLRQTMGEVSSLPTVLGSQVQTALVPFVPTDSSGRAAQVDIVLQVSNYCEHQGGLLYAPLIGEYDTLARRAHHAQAMQYALFGITLVLALLQLMPGSGRTRRSGRFLLVAALLMLAFNSLSTGMPYRPTGYTWISWRLFYMLQYSLLLAGAALTLLYVRKVGHQPLGARWLLALTLAGFALMLGPIVLPGIAYTLLTTLYQGYVLLVALLLIVSTSLPRYPLRRDARWVLCAGVASFAAGMLIDHMVISAGRWSLQSWQQVGTVLLVASTFYLKLQELRMQQRLSNSMLMRCRAQNDRLGRENEQLTQHTDALSENAKDLNDERNHRIWQDEGLKKIRQALSPRLDSLEMRCQVGLNEVTRYVAGNVAALYMARFDAEAGALMLHLTASYGFTAEERTQLDCVAIGEGLVGACFAENTFESLTELDGCPFKISSGLGRTVPPALVLAPLNSEAGIIGVLEVGRIAPFASHELSFLRQAAILVASNLMLTQTKEQDQVRIDSLMQAITKKDGMIADLTAQNKLLRQRLDPAMPADGLF